MPDVRLSNRPLARRLAAGKVRLTAAFLERLLLSDRLRPVLVKDLERRVLLRRDQDWAIKVPAQARQDQADLTLALLYSAERALERGLIARPVVRRLVRSFLVALVLREDESAAAASRAFSERHPGQLPPTLIVVSPTRACNLHCTGCYAAAAANGEHLSAEMFGRIIADAKALWGLRFFTISGGEPLMWRADGRDLLDVAAEHPDCFFHVYTNGTLIDTTVAERMRAAGNLTPAISVEGLEGATDARRGRGTFRRILAAMERLRAAGVPFGVSFTATRWNAEAILSDEVVDFFFERQGASYGWIFQYMPIGRAASLELMVTPEQRLAMWRRTWHLIRERRLFLADFWNCGTATNGCIAAGQHGGAGYFYIDWNGNVMPCVFVPYAAANLNDIYDRGGTLDEVYDLPYFRALRDWQREYALGKESPQDCGNLLRPCSLRDHYQVGRRLIDTYRPAPEDQNAAEALVDPAYAEGMTVYDRQLAAVFDPIWERDYVGRREAP